MKIIIAGAGKVGTMLTRWLVSEGHEIILVDRQKEVLETCSEKFDILAVQGNCAAVGTLKQTGVEDSEVIIAVTGSDEFNLLCCLTAHSLNPDIHTIARIRNPEYTEQVYNMQETFASSLAVNPEKDVAREIDKLLKYPGFLRRDTFAKGRAEIVELKVKPGSPLENISLMDLNNIVKSKVLVCAINRGGVVSAPSGEFVLQTGDHLFVTGSRDELTKMLKHIGVITRKVKSVMLCGGGKVGYYLAKILSESGVEVELIERDLDRCEHLAEVLPGVSVVNGDASSQGFLESEGIQNCDAVVAITSFDEMNMIISLYAKNYGVNQVVTKVDHVDNHSIQDAIGLESVVCPKDLCCNHIVRYIRAMENKSGAALSIHTFADGQMEALEFKVDADTKNIDVPLRDMQLKKGVLIACITRGGKLIIPDGSSSYKVNDGIVVVKSGDENIGKINDIFV
ncbi:MAG: Trk system potassium transporter TrkA [Lachnospiraceae bacterium]|nr:Trk system potassium transporter TrkA [Lachnospiraceae bacterium]